MTTYFGYATSVDDTQAITAKGVNVYGSLIDPNFLAQNIAGYLPDVDVVVLNDGLPAAVLKEVRAALNGTDVELKLVSELPDKVS